eukprot:CAMPEP_0169063126 /NCGR_PEP_ID=MMETSP1015-20121227/1103_1 /TAXON_ID=342587 /ORGANISM="Karlodinium micrum, Strain CCMP2283" /LENGTH=103 /DNA_ID=CAMNT_0009121411 /DNA_START=586 /DNA_END=897 /DNA_ORIENTATION=+
MPAVAALRPYPTENTQVGLFANVGSKGMVQVAKRAAGVSYLRYSNEMASILRQCLKEPFREAAVKRDMTNITEKVWANGLVAGKYKIDEVKNGFESQTGEGKK